MSAPLHWRSLNGSRRPAKAFTSSHLNFINIQTSRFALVTKRCWSSPRKFFVRKALCSQRILSTIRLSRFFWLEERFWLLSERFWKVITWTKCKNIVLVIVFFRNSGHLLRVQLTSFTNRGKWHSRPNMFSEHCSVGLLFYVEALSSRSVTGWLQNTKAPWTYAWQSNLKERERERETGYAAWMSWLLWTGKD